MEQERSGADWRFCKKCLVRDLKEDELAETMQAYIARIDADIKTPPQTYEARLLACTECEQLLRGMCRVCGCYVEMRAAVKTNGCPAVHPRW